MKWMENRVQCIEQCWLMCRPLIKTLKPLWVIKDCHLGLEQSSSPGQYSRSEKYCKCCRDWNGVLNSRLESAVSLAAGRMVMRSIAGFQTASLAASDWPLWPGLVLWLHPWLALQTGANIFERSSQNKANLLKLNVLRLEWVALGVNRSTDRVCPPPRPRRKTLRSSSISSCSTVHWVHASLLHEFFVLHKHA